MRRLLLLTGAAGVAAGVCAGRCAHGRGGRGFAKAVERMPENARPKWMLRNITAIRENTERILQLLESEPPTHAEHPPRSTE